MLMAEADRHRSRIEERRQLNDELARLIAWAVHKPNKMPSYKPLKKKQPRPEETDAAEVYARHVFRRWSEKGMP